MAREASAASAERVVVDIGNTRIKWGLLGPDDRLIDTWASDPSANDGRTQWLDELGRRAITGRASWAISSVNPPVAKELGQLLAELSDRPARWYRSAADVPIKSKLLHPETAGADRALLALAGGAITPANEPGLVISCGTALTVERVDSSKVWEGGAIAPGLDLAARSLHRGAAQIPAITPHAQRPPWGRTTEDAVGGGVFWGTVGLVRELIARQQIEGWRLWTGGNAAEIAPHIEPAGHTPWIVDHLVLRGLAMAAFGASPSAITP